LIAAPFKIQLPPA
jgi:hypothetical protein